MIGPELEGARPAAGPGFADAVTFAFGDPAANLYGTARLGLLPGEPPRASALALLFADGDLAASPASAGEAAAGGWERFDTGAVRSSVVAPLREWRVAMDDGRTGFDLAFTALSEPVELGEDSAAARAAGLHGYEQLCRVRGSARAGGREVEVDALGQRGHQWGSPDWDRLDSARSVSAWLGPGLAVTLSTVRPAGAGGHDEELISAFVVESAGEAPEDLAGLIVEVAEPRLSTLTDSEGRQRRASAELWPGEEGGYPRRMAGSIVCGTSVELGPLALDAAFFAWTMEGREGVGRYDVLRRAAGA